MGENKGERTMAGAAASVRGASEEEKRELDEGAGKPADRVSGADLLSEHRAAMARQDDRDYVDDVDDENPTAEDEEPQLPSPKPVSSGYPAWARFQENVVFKPPRGARVAFMRFPSEWTLAPDVGAEMDDLKNGKRYRWCVMWSLSPGDEILAAGRCRGEALRTIDEFTKQAIRVVDGYAADWSGHNTPGTVNTFWRQLGPACRKELKNIYVQTHALTREQRIHFFVNCVELATSAG